MTQPGAFAKALQNERCTCPRDDEARRAIMVKQTVIIRPKKVIPTECQYTSIEELRKRIYKRIDKDVLNHLREAQFIGCVSDQRSLIQCGQHLVLINHMEMAKDLFYQLALLRFRGGAPIARLGIADESGGIQIETAIAHAFEIEDRLNSLDGRGDLELMKEKSSPSEEGSTYLMEISNTNRAMARQATSFLLEKAEMLEQYFSIRIESRRSLNNTPRTERLGEDKKGEIDDDETEAYLTGLPELLEGHCPCLHGLPVFLLRLATQVDWNEEKPCFHGISREVGSYYAMMPLSAEDPDEDKGFDGDDICSGSAMAMNISNTPSSSSSSYVQHQIFPALSHLLLPPKRLSREGYFAIQTNLSELYKMFQR
jgi:DNA mismatch repair protein MLH1